MNIMKKEHKAKPKAKPKVKPKVKHRHKWVQQESCYCPTCECWEYDICDGCGATREHDFTPKAIKRKKHKK